VGAVWELLAWLCKLNAKKLLILEFILLERQLKFILMRRIGGGKAYLSPVSN